MHTHSYALIALPPSNAERVGGPLEYILCKKEGKCVATVERVMSEREQSGSRRILSEEPVVGMVIVLMRGLKRTRSGCTVRVGSWRLMLP